MVTWFIKSGPKAGNYVIAWEDLAGTGDQDYQDLVVEIENATVFQRLNNLVTFRPVAETQFFNPDTTGCQPGSVGKFGFNAELENVSDQFFFPNGKALSDLNVGVRKLTNDNQLLVNNELFTVSDLFPVNNDGGYADGQLLAFEMVEVPFTVCLQELKPFQIRVDLLGFADDIN
jgi:hypothetical protein